MSSPSALTVSDRERDPEGRIVHTGGRCRPREANPSRTRGCSPIGTATRLGAHVLRERLLVQALGAF